MDWFWNWGANVSGIGKQIGTSCSTSRSCDASSLTGYACNSHKPVPAGKRRKCGWRSRAEKSRMTPTAQKFTLISRGRAGNCGMSPGCASVCGRWPIGVTRIRSLPWSRSCSSEEKSIDQRIQNVGDSLMRGWQAVGRGLARELLSVVLTRNRLRCYRRYDIQELRLWMIR